MSDYVPLSSHVHYVSPHDEQPVRRDPWFVWAIAISPLAPLAVLVWMTASAGWAAILITVAAFVATSVGCVYLARRDQRAIVGLGSATPVNALLALVPGVYLLVRGARRAAEPHRGNPLHPVVLNFFTSFALGYYLVLVLMGVLAIVNRGSIS